MATSKVLEAHACMMSLLSRYLRVRAWGNRWRDPSPSLSMILIIHYSASATLSGTIGWPVVSMRDGCIVQEVGQFREGVPGDMAGSRVP